MKGNPSRKGACDQLAWRPYAMTGQEGISSVQDYGQDANT